MSHWRRYPWRRGRASGGKHHRAHGDAFEPDDLTDLRLWLRADLGVTLVDGRVSEWADQSGKLHHATQITALSRPGVGALVGGAAAIDFGGGTYFLTIPHHVDLQSAAGMHWWIVFEAASTNPTNTILLSKWGASSEWLIPARRGSSPNTSAFAVRNSANTANHVIDGPLVHDDADHVLRARIDDAGTTMGLKVDAGTETTLGSITFRQSTLDVTIGDYDSGSGNVDARIAEIVMAVATAEERANVDAYMESRYGVAL
jgi:hypothetical protein